MKWRFDEYQFGGKKGWGVGGDGVAGGESFGEGAAPDAAEGDGGAGVSGICPDAAGEQAGDDHRDYTG